MYLRNTLLLRVNEYIEAYPIYLEMYPTFKIIDRVILSLLAQKALIDM